MLVAAGRTTSTFQNRLFPFFFDWKMTDNYFAIAYYTVKTYESRRMEKEVKEDDKEKTT